MKKISLMILIWMAGFVFSGMLYAEDIYVTGITNITMRTGPGVSHKIVAMLKSGTRLEIINYQTDWSQVRTSGGKEGWVLSRFLTQKVPDALLVEKLQHQNASLEAKLSQVEEENRSLTIKNATLLQIEEKYKKLKQESADFLKLDAEYKETLKKFEAQKKRIENLEEESQTEIKFWVLIGPGVFIVGMFLGLSTRKRKKSSLL